MLRGRHTVREELSVDRDVEPLANYTIRAQDERACSSWIRLEEGGEAPGLNVMCFDIEVYNPLGNPRPEKDPIIMISYKMVKEGKRTAA